MSVMCVFGTRPEIIKMSPVIHALDNNGKRRAQDYILVQSGQHYDSELSGILLDELNIREPDYNLEVGSGSQAEQTAKMLVGFESIMLKCEPKLVLAQGDTNTVLAAGLSARKLGIAFGHVEAGLRCHDERMPEEINRKVADQCAKLCFAPTRRSALNLLHEGISPNKIRITGNTVVDAVKRNLPIALKKSSLRGLGLWPDEESAMVVALTLHRAENVDEPATLKLIVDSILGVKDCRIVFPIHPRTLNRLARSGNLSVLEKADNVTICPPLGYLEFLELLHHSKLVITDSGGIQEEALTLRLPCITLRNCTERPETIEAGGNRLVSTSSSGKLSAVVAQVLRESHSRAGDVWTKGNPLGDGRAGERIAKICHDFGRTDLMFESLTYPESQ